MSDPNSVTNQSGDYICKICGSTFLTVLAFAAHIDSEHPDAEQPEIF